MLRQKQQSSVQEETVIKNDDPTRVRFINTLRDSGYRVIDDNGVVMVLVSDPCKIYETVECMIKIAHKIGYDRSYGACTRPKE